MKIKDTFKNWSEEKKKAFSIILAGIITVLIVIVWFSINPLFNPVVFDNKTQTNNTDYLNDSLNKITEQYNTVVNQISNLGSLISSTTAGTSSLQDTEVASTSAENSSSSVEFSTSTI